MLRIEAPNEPMMRYCCWNSCIRLSVVDGPEVAPQVTSRPPRLRQSSEPLKVSAPTCSNTTSTPFLAGELAHHAFEAVGAVVDDVIGAERLGLLGLGVVADGGDDGAADRLRHLDRDGADAGAAGMHQHGLAGLELGVVEQHVLHGREGDRRAGGVAHGDAGRHRDDQPRRHVEEFAGEAVDVKAHDAGDVFAQIVAAFAAGLAGAAGEGAIHHHRIAGLEAPSRRRRPPRSRRRPRRRPPAASCAWRRPCRASPTRRYD